MGRVLRQLRFVWHHPASRRRRLAACVDWIAWQLRSRLLGARTFRWVLGLRVAAAPGMHGITCNVGVGLADFEGMAFLLHYLRPADLFVDIGANAGSYSLLASGRGARVIASEPNERARAFFQRSLALNSLEAEVLSSAIADGEARVSMDLEADARGSILEGGQPGGTLVDATTLDAVVGDRQARLVKIDVEGAEARVIAGGKACLRCTSAAIVETWGKKELHDQLERLGLTPVRYEPLGRELAAWHPSETGDQNVIFVRDLGEARERLASASGLALGPRSAI